MLNLIKQKLKATPVYPLYKNVQAKFFEMNPEKFISDRYEQFYGDSIDFSFPEKLSEKMQLLKIYYYPKCKKVIQATDKYTLHAYLKQRHLNYLAVPYIQVYTQPKDFNLAVLPNEFVLKKTNASGLNLIVKNKNKMSEKNIKKTLAYWFSFNYGKFSQEPHYSQAIDRVICEPFFNNLGNEYRFFMVNGEVGFIQVIVWDWDQRGQSQKVNNEFVIEGHSKHYRLHFNEDWKLYWKDENTPDIEIAKPSNFEQLRKISKHIAKDFPVVRVDFNEINGKTKISELTFTPASGYLQILKQKPELDIELGKKLRVEGNKKK